MGDAGFYRGTSADQDSRFSDKQKKLLKTMRFEEVLLQKVDITKVHLDVVKPWIITRVLEILGMEDDVVTEFIFSQLEDATIDPRIMQINLTGFLNAKKAREFMGELWQLLVDGQKSADGIPPALLELKMEQLRKKKADDDRDAAARSSREDIAAAADRQRRRRSPSSPVRRAPPSPRRRPSPPRFERDRPAPPRFDRRPPAPPPPPSLRNRVSDEAPRRRRSHSRSPPARRRFTEQPRVERRFTEQRRRSPSPARPARSPVHVKTAPKESPERRHDSPVASAVKRESSEEPIRRHAVNSHADAADSSKTKKKKKHKKHKKHRKSKKAAKTARSASDSDVDERHKKVAEDELRDEALRTIKRRKKNVSASSSD